MKLTNIIFALLFLLGLLSPLSAEEAKGATPNVDEWIIHHVINNSEWHPFPPLHNFSVKLPQGYQVRGIDVSPTLHLLMMVIVCVFLVLVFGVLYRKKSNAAPRGITNALELLVVFVRDEVVYPYTGVKDGRKLLPIFLTFFFFILTLNFLGLIPAFAAATGNVNVTAGLALITMSMMVIGGLIKNGPVGFIKLFLPPGVPVPFYVLLFPIEFLGLFTRPFALTMRLFANMLGGHIVIYSMVSLVIRFGWIGVPALGLALFSYSLEVLVAFIQAYVFTLLSAMFVGSMMHPSH